MITMITKEERMKQIKSREDYKDNIKRIEDERRAASELFNIDDFIIDAELIREVYVEEIDRRVQYKKLNVGENSEVAKIKDVQLRGQTMLYMMLHKVDPEITENQIIEISSDVATAILTAIVGDQTFLKDSVKRP